jgi:hypothetical protein
MCACAARGEAPRGGELLGWENRSIAEYLAGIAGLASIAALLIGILVFKAYRDAIIASVACTCLCILFLCIPSLVTTFKWTFAIATGAIILGGGFFGFSHWNLLKKKWGLEEELEQTQVAVKVVAATADKFEKANTPDAIVKAKLQAVKEQADAGVHELIHNLRKETT